MKKLAVFIGILAVLSFGNAAWATFYSGSEGNMTSAIQTNGVYTMIDVGGMGASGNAWMGIVTGGALQRSQGVHLEWSVNDTANPGNWTYTYTFTENSNVNSKQMTSFYLDFGGGSTDIASQTLMGYGSRDASGLGTPLSNGVLGTYTPSGGPGTIDGLQWTFSTSSPFYYSVALTLVTENAPVWGDYLSVGPVAAGNGISMMAWDLGFGTTSQDPIGSGNYAGYEYVMVPGAAAVPVPAAVLLLGSGLAGLGLLKRKFFFKA